jgi:hypothetical protein
VAIGANAGAQTQGQNAVAIGVSAGLTLQGSGAIAIGLQADGGTQGANAIAIGALAASGSQAAGSVCINASGVAIGATQVGAYIAPIREDNTQTAAVCYNATTKEITYATSGTKTFVIDHPTDAERYLVHACLEGPEAGVYYRGEAAVPEGAQQVVVRLPAYAAVVATDYSVQITPIFSGSLAGALPSYAASRVVDGAFTVYGAAGEFFWHVVGRRAAVEVEPRKADVEVKGDGPYRWI